MGLEFSSDLKNRDENSRERKKDTAAFSEVDRWMRDRGASGTVKIGKVGGIFLIYLKGWVTYATYEVGDEEKYGQDALDTIPEHEEFVVELKLSNHRKSEMARTYMEYIGREDRLIDVHAVSGSVEERTVVVTEVGNLRKKELPEGERVGYSSDEKRLASWFAGNGGNGYGLSNHSVVFFEGGEESEREHLKDDNNPLLVDGDIEDLGCRYLNVTPAGSEGEGVYEIDIDGWEVVRTEDGGDILGLF